jgi:hypothetical protein
MFYLHSKNKENQKIIILGRKTWKPIVEPKDARYSGEYTRELAEKEIVALEALPERDKFWVGEIRIVELD